MRRRTRARTVTAYVVAAFAAACSPQVRTFQVGDSTGGGGHTSSSTGGGGHTGSSTGSSSTTESTGTVMCMPVSDPAFCMSLGKSCEQVTGIDNCGTARTVMCGTCTAPQVCSGNVCQAAVCANLSFSAMPVLIPGANLVGAQNVIAAVTPSGATLLVQRGNPCGVVYSLLVADETSVGSGTYTTTSVAAPPGMDVFAEEQPTLTADGLTILAPNTAHTGFLASTRSAPGAVDFGLPVGADYVALTATGTQQLGSPALSPDGLAFYYSVTGDPASNGIYETVRASISAPFPAATLMPGPVQSYVYVMGFSTDRMAMFLMGGSLNMVVLTRTSLLQPFVNPNDPAAPPSVPGFRTRPLASCKMLIGTCTPGGCSNEQICTFPSQ